MNLHYKTVVNYVKNLFPGCAPVASSKTPELDANVLSTLSLDNFYIVARNGKKYWYCCVMERDIPVVKRIMQINGLRGSKHHSLFSYRWFLRVPADHVEKDPSRRVFISAVMDKELGILNEDMYKSHLNIVRQRMK